MMKMINTKISRLYINFDSRSYSTKVYNYDRFLFEQIEESYEDLQLLGYPVISEEEFDSQLLLILEGVYELSPFRIRYRDAQGVKDFQNRSECILYGIASNNPYVDKESQIYRISSTALKDEVVLMGLARAIFQFHYYYNIELDGVVENLAMEYFDRILSIRKSTRLYRIRIRFPLLGGAISKTRVLEIVSRHISTDSITFQLVKKFLYNTYQNEEGQN